MRGTKKYNWLVVALFLFMGMQVHAQGGQPYLCEIGLQGGAGYYVGDATPHIFMNPREAYGVHFRYKFTKRWALQAKFSGQRIEGNQYTIRGRKLDTRWSNRLYNVDLMAEFNFFRFGSGNRYDKRIKPYTPYIFIGLGAGMYSDMDAKGAKKITAAGYLPLGIRRSTGHHLRLHKDWPLLPPGSGPVQTGLYSYPDTRPQE